MNFLYYSSHVDYYDKYNTAQWLILIYFSISIYEALDLR